MRTLSIKVEERIFSETTNLASQLLIGRDKYILKALVSFNKSNKRLLLKKKLKRESSMTRVDSMEVLKEFHYIDDLY